jgi:hypothetical protein
MKSRSQIAVEALDEVAHRMERKWGVGRLPRLVSVDLAAKFCRQVEKLNAEILEEATAGIADVDREAGRMVNAWMALDAAAEAAGADQASASYLTARMSDGRLLAVSDSSEGMQDFVRENAGQGAAVWTIDEVVRVLEGFDLVNRTKHLFPGAKVEQARVDPETMKPKVDWKKGDALPDVMMAG